METKASVIVHYQHRQLLSIQSKTLNQLSNFQITKRCLVGPLFPSELAARFCVLRAAA